ncbi:hypothetical protein ACFXKX_17235 [Streptomyces scopuliridis]
MEIDDRDGRRPAIEDIFHRHGFHTEVTQQREYRDTGLRALFARRHR